MAKNTSTHLFDSKLATGPVECLGMTFESDDARRAYFLDLLRKKLKDPAFRKIEGFPIGHDEAILALSDPPHFTACPNPFLLAFLATFSRDHAPTPQHTRLTPFAADITEGKTDHFYNVHTYHTKVPFRAIARFILHYTRPGNVILDGFCGTGMTGLAAQACNDKSFVRDLDPDLPEALVGPRLTIVGDLSPAATHIAANYNAHVADKQFVEECNSILQEFTDELGWMFSTTDSATGKPAKVDYFVWSDVFGCPNCGYEIVFWDEGVDEETGHKSAEKEMRCPSCKALSHRDKYARVEETYFDDILGTTATKQKEALVLVVYRMGKKVQSKEPSKGDHQLLKRIASEPVGDVPVLKMMNRDGAWGDMYRAGYHLGITHFHHFYYRRSLRAFAWLWRRANQAPEALRPRLRWWLQSVAVGHTRLNRYFASSYSQVNRYLKGFLYIAQVRSETAPWYTLKGKVKKMARCGPGTAPIAITTGSATALSIPDSTIDYIFTDPPFGGNIMYSELNFMWEAWFGVLTNQVQEAIVSKSQKKDLTTYQHLMERSFAEYRRVLRPGAWMTVEFHNSHNAVWIAIQRALEAAGFVVADVRVFDKEQLTMKQQTTTGAVKKDLIISAYRPNDGLEDQFRLVAGSEEGVWRFVDTHLKQLPVVVASDGKLEAIAERAKYLLFDRMVAFHVQRGVAVPMSVAEFQIGLHDRYPERDGMYFLSEQAADYDRQRMRGSGVVQLDLFVSNEATAIQWIKQQLGTKPQTFQEIQPQFMKEVAGWAKHEKHLELAEVLEQNFICFDGNGAVPSQIHGYLSTNFKELRNLPKGHPSLVAKAKSRWYVPDFRKEADLEKIRHRALMKEFGEYRQATGKLKVIRTEALRAGFKDCWQKQDYHTIVEMAKRVKEEIIQEDPALLMYYDNALTRTEE